MFFRCDKFAQISQKILAGLYSLRLGADKIIRPEPFKKCEQERLVFKYDLAVERVGLDCYGCSHVLKIIRVINRSAVNNNVMLLGRCFDCFLGPTFRRDLGFERGQVLDRFRLCDPIKINGLR